MRVDVYLFVSMRHGWVLPIPALSQRLSNAPWPMREWTRRTPAPHVFRHTLATEMLRQGASLGEIGAAAASCTSGHDPDLCEGGCLTALRPLALRWPGGGR